MNIEEARAILREDRRNNWGQGERLAHVTRTTPDSLWHAVLYSDLDEHNADGVIEEQISHFRSINREFEWKLFGDDEPLDLRQRLVKHGFEIGELERVVVYDLANGLASFEVPEDCTAKRITDVDEVALYREIAEAVFGKVYELTSGELIKAIEENSTNHLGYIGYVDGEPASMGRLYTHPLGKFGGLYGGGTLEKFRHRGCYRAVIAERAKDALEFGAEYLLVDAMPTSLPTLLRLGFVHVTDTWACTWRP